MTVISVPPLEEEPWPTLGPQVCAYIEATLCFGPGDLLGTPAKVDEEKRGLIYRCYEVHPKGARDENGKPIEGRRRFNRVSLALAKGTAKTELAAWIGACELSPEAPVRCDGFDSYGRPVGRSVMDPYIPLMAYTEEQSDDLAYTALRAILERSRIAQLFDIGFERILRAQGDGKAVALAGAPDARDGARTTWQHKDETHRWNLERLRRSHRTTLGNLAKRTLADPWELETTTAYVPGQNSVAEQTAKYAADVGEGKIKDSRLFYFYRYTSDGYELSDQAQLEAAIVEALGPVCSGWRDIKAIAAQWQDPEADRPYLERVFLNRRMATAAQAFSATAWAKSAQPGVKIAAGQKITLGFDGSLYEDATALIATHLATGFQWPIGIWEKPPAFRGQWEVPKAVVNSVVEETFATYDVVLLYGDPSKWDSEMAAWAGKYGKRVVAWPTTLYRKMATALKMYANAIEAGDVPHNGDAAFARHIGNAQRNEMNFRDDDGSPLWLIQKDRPGSPNKIDGGMAGCLSKRAQLDAIATGATGEPSVYESRGFQTF